MNESCFGVIATCNYDINKWVMVLCLKYNRRAQQHLLYMYESGRTSPVCVLQIIIHKKSFDNTRMLGMRVCCARIV